MKRFVLDESTSKRLARLLRDEGLDVSPFPNAWKGVQNGHLIGLVVSAGYSALLTCDQSLSYQQDLTRRPISLIVLPTNRTRELVAAIREIADALHAIGEGEVRLVRLGQAQQRP